MFVFFGTGLHLRVAEKQEKILGVADDARNEMARTLAEFALLGTHGF